MIKSNTLTILDLDYNFIDISPERKEILKKQTQKSGKGL